MIDFVKDEIRDKIDLKQEQKFIRTIKDLKQFRENSDYENVQIERTMSEMALVKAKEIRHFLQHHLNV